MKNHKVIRFFESAGAAGWSDVWLFFAVLLLTAVLSTFPGGSSAGPPASAYKYSYCSGENVARLLVDYGFCRSIEECTRREIVLLDRSESKLVYEIYEIGNLKIIKEVVKICVDGYFESSDGPDLVLRFFEEAHGKYMGVAGLFEKPFMQIELNRK